jgi:hypothetical protein
LAAAAPGPLVTAGLNLPPRQDWRAANGQDFIGPARDQLTCGACVAFAVCAAVEAAFRIARADPADPIDLSEAHLFYDLGNRACAAAWNPPEALEAVRTTGVVDEACRPYTVGSAGGPLCPNWEARVHRITGAQSVFGLEPILRWLATRGPLVAPYNVYDDFDEYVGGIYRRQSPDFVGQHALCVVGYDEPAACWIVKNSFGPAWGEGNGFARVAWGECGIDAVMWGVLGVVE